MTTLPEDAVVYVYICKGDAQPEDFEVRDLLPADQRWRKIVFLRYENGNDPESLALARLYSIGPTYLSFVTTGVDKKSRSHFDQVLPPSRAHWVAKAHEHLEASKSLRRQLRRAQIPSIVIVAHAHQLSVYACRLTRLSERGQADLGALIQSLHQELQALVLAALR